MKITLVVKAPKWSTKNADAFAEAIQQMLFNEAMAAADESPAFVASYKVEKAKKRKAKRT